MSKAEIRDFASLQQLLLLERFNQAFADDSELVVWLLNKSLKTLSESARLADEFTTLRRVNKPTYKKQFQNPSESQTKTQDESQIGF